MENALFRGVRAVINVPQADARCRRTWARDEHAGGTRGASLQIERWLNKTQKERHWSDNTWNRYYELLSTLCVRATRWKANGVPRTAQNPMTAIERRVAAKKKFRVRIEEPVEDQLFAACDKLNRPQHKPHGKLLTWLKVEEIRKWVVDGESQKNVAADFGISAGLCCQIVQGEVWNPEKYRVGTKGDMMLMAAFDAGCVARR
jgi:hypothetical protein